MSARILVLRCAVLALVLTTGSQAFAEAESDRLSIGGYLRLMTRPDFQGGDGRLGYWNLYGRLLNEGPWAALEVKLDLLQPQPGSSEIWTSVHARVEGGSVANGEAQGGRLDNFRLSQLYVRAGNVLFKDVTWQLGTLEYYYGDLGLYDMRPAQLFFETLGLSARYDDGDVEWLVGVGDSGFFLKGAEYNTVLTAGSALRLRLFGHLELGVGGQLFFEPSVAGNRFAPSNTPGVRYEDYLRGEVVQEYILTNPGRDEEFPRPVPTSALSYKLVAYLGFGDLGFLRWNNLFGNLQLRHPDGFTTERYTDPQTRIEREFLIFVEDLTDERYEANLGNEMQLELWPGHLETIWSVYFGYHWDMDNDIAPSDADRTVLSTVVRLQYYLLDSVHLLAETSFAREVSHNGNTYRLHRDSVFTNPADDESFEVGDSNTRDTWQGKVGLVLNPMGLGMYTRPSLRVLYGVQYSTQNNAFGNSFVDSLDQYNYFGAEEAHWHHVFALEVEAWF